MSVKLILDEFETMGRLHITDMNDYSGGHEYTMQIRAIINCVKAADPEMIDKDDLYWMMRILANYMPTEKQADALLKASLH